MIEESEIFVKQVFKLKSKYRKIETDIASLKLELPKLVFRSMYPLNIHIAIINRPETSVKNVWRIRVLNSDINKGKSGGYRIFYCEGRTEKSILLLGVYPKPEIKDNEYQTIAKELVAASCE